MKTAAVEEELKKTKTEFQQYASLSGIYNRFQHLYKGDGKKMKSLETFKVFGKQMGEKDSQFKKNFDELCLKMQKQYINSSVIRIQTFFSNYIKMIDKKINSCSIDIEKLKRLKQVTIQNCSETNSLGSNTLMAHGRIRTMNNLFDNQIKVYQCTINQLKLFKSEGILEFDEKQLQLSQMNRSFYMSDAEMHQNQEQRTSFYEKITL